jgi:hypothetical protein
MEEMRKFSEQEKARQDAQKYKEYLRNKDAADGISQRSGPTGSMTKGGGSIGYKWSTK